MQVLLSRQILRRLQRELRRAGRQEIGGLLMGEHVCDETFRVVDVSIQRSGGSEVCFIRDPKDHQAQLNSFFARTGADYTPFQLPG
jgi:[CysO sulfur-carrier protein]-S-L-cysteine hydrolase